MDDRAGLEFARRVKRDSPHTPVLLQSSNAEYGRVAAELGACFLHKRSPTLIQELRNFTLNNFGFGDFVFRLPDGSEIVDPLELDGNVWRYVRPARFPQTGDLVEMPVEGDEHRAGLEGVRGNPQVVQGDRGAGPLQRCGEAAVDLGRLPRGVEDADVRPGEERVEFIAVLSCT
jgi:hypothetical protein